MNIIEAAIRRILIRNADKAITGGAKSLAEAGQTSYAVILPTIPTLIWNVIALAIILFLLTSISLAFDLSFFTYIIPFLFIFRIIRPVKGFTYDVKSEAIYKSDRRYTTGRKIVGYKEIEDKSKRIEFTESQILIGRVEAALKGLVIAITFGFIYQSLNSDHYKVSSLKESELLTYLTVGDTLYAKASTAKIYGQFKSKYNDKIEFTDFAESKSKLVGVFVKVDSVQSGFEYRTEEQKDSTNAKYKAEKPKFRKWIVVTPTTDIKTYDPILYNMKDRVNNIDYVRPGDVTISVTVFKRK